jgi:hypothetical protein
MWDCTSALMFSFATVPSFFTSVTRSFSKPLNICQLPKALVVVADKGFEEGLQWQ